MKRIVMTAALLSAFACFAEEDAMPEVPATNAVPAKAFTTLPLCRRVEGRASVRKPGGDWIEAEEGKFYPFGTDYRAEKDGIMVIAFGSGSTVTIANGSSFGTRAQKIGVDSRTIVLLNGTVDIRLPDNLSEGAFFATAPGFTLKNPAGESRVVYVDKGDGDLATVRCITGSLGLEGRHFDVPTMHSADEVDIRTSRDHLFTSLYGNSGDFVINVDQGVCYKEEFGEDGQLRNVVHKDVLEWHMTPRTKIVINRAVPSIGERMSVHTMAFDAAGICKSERKFCEGRAEVNSGEIAAVALAKAKELAKRVVEGTDEGSAQPAAQGEKPAEGEADAEEKTSSEEE